MAGSKFYGPIGYGTDVESPAGGGVWIKEVTEVPYFGDITRNSRRLNDGSQVNNDLSVGNSLSIVADPYALEHFHEMLYIKWLGAYWLVSQVEVVPDSPRLTLRLGGVYNGPVFEPAPEPPVGGFASTFESNFRG